MWKKYAYWVVFTFEILNFCFWKSYITPYHCAWSWFFVWVWNPSILLAHLCTISIIIFQKQTSYYFNFEKKNCNFSVSFTWSIHLTTRDSWLLNFLIRPRRFQHYYLSCSRLDSIYQHQLSLQLYPIWIPKNWIKFRIYSSRIVFEFYLSISRTS